jgi:signal transduction histidine kinase
MTVAISPTGFVVFGALLSGVFTGARAGQLLVTLVLPTLVMVGFWFVARARLLAREAEFENALELENVTNRANGEFLAGVSHELQRHLQLCSLRAESLAVAIDYRNVNPELKVAVPDVVVITDPHLLRQLLHILVGNAVRHGGSRIAIWASSEDDAVRLTVSDDGPGLAPELGAHIFERYLDLAPNGRSSRPAGAGLSLARTLSELMGGRMTYKRDPSWSHFSIRLPLGSDSDRPSRDRVPLQAGVR